jgi:hypothetical protein
MTITITITIIIRIETIIIIVITLIAIIGKTTITKMITIVMITREVARRREWWSWAARRDLNWR